MARLNNKLVAALRLMPIADCYLLRSMCVSKDLRQQGIGGTLLQQIQPQLNSLICYCFPYTHLITFYKHAGFINCESGKAPRDPQTQPQTDPPKAIQEKFNSYIKNDKKICLMKHQQSMLK